MTDRSRRIVPNCRYLAAPQSASRGSQFSNHLDALGIRLPSNLSLRTMVQRGWLRPRVRVSIPVPALLSWENFPRHPIHGDEACPDEERWGLEAWCAATSSFSDRDRVTDKLWMHWLDDPDDETAGIARAHALDPIGAPEPSPFFHPQRGENVLPWIDFFADWQAYNVAELVRRAEFCVEGVTDQFGSNGTCVEAHTTTFDQHARKLAEQWEGRGAFLDHIACYRTILANCATRDTFIRDAQLGARSWASQRGVTPEKIRSGIRDVLLCQWQRWSSSPPVRGEKLMHRLQQDLHLATRLLWDLTGEPVDPFDPFWYSDRRGHAQWAQLIEALPFEEWLARRDFPELAVRYQWNSPNPFVMGKPELSDLVARHWPTCPPLRRFCLAWVRLHKEMRGGDRDLPADATIAANERIEQFNLVALHTERLMRNGYDVFHPRQPEDPQPEARDVVLDAIERALRRAADGYQSVAAKRADKLFRRTSLRTMPDATDLLVAPSDVNCGSSAADHVVAAHLNALIARNYAAHHEYLDDDLVYPGQDEAKPHVGATLLSSCLVVTVAALHGLSERAGEACP